jgi:hypothetical protein
MTYHQQTHNKFQQRTKRNNTPPPNIQIKTRQAYTLAGLYVLECFKSSPKRVKLPRQPQILLRIQMPSVFLNNEVVFNGFGMHLGKFEEQALDVGTWGWVYVGFTGAEESLRGGKGNKYATLDIGQNNAHTPSFIQQPNGAVDKRFVR